jgi:hypothetical protein
MPSICTIASAAAENNSSFKTTVHREINDYLLDQVFALPLAERAVIWLTRNRLKTIAPMGRQMFQMPDTWLDG